MPIESKLTRAPMDAKNQCHGVSKYGQCPYIAMENSVFCSLHNGPMQEKVASEKRKRAYKLSQWQARVDEHADDDEVKSLRGEVGILRMTLETVLVQCKDDLQVLMHAPRIGDLVTKIEKVVVSCHRLEERTGVLLDKQAALNIGVQIVEVVSRYVTNGEHLAAIGDEIVKAILAATPRTIE